jgi:hypothetical protein
MSLSTAKCKCTPRPRRLRGARKADPLALAQWGNALSGAGKVMDYAFSNCCPIIFFIFNAKNLESHIFYYHSKNTLLQLQSVTIVKMHSPTKLQLNPFIFKSELG